MNGIRSRPVLALVLVAGGFLTFGMAGRMPDVVPVTDSDMILAKIPAMELDRTPFRILIPQIGVDIPVQSVGLDPSGRMAVPDSYTDAGWFRFGPEPGNIGNAVIAAHLTDKAGLPAAFGNLSKLKPNDLIHVDTPSGRATFRIVGSRSYDAEDAPLEEIFGPYSGARLNLITCNGDWQKGVRSYSKRLVVFSELEGSARPVLP